METNVSKRRWCVVVSKPHGEKVALANLKNQAFEVYLPYAVTQRPQRRRSASVDVATSDNGEAGAPKIPLGYHIRPLFPRHLFVRIDPDAQQWKSIWSTLGVSSMLMAGGERPLFVRDTVIDYIREREDGELAAMLPKASPSAKQPVIAVEPKSEVAVEGGMSAEQIAALKAGDKVKVNHLGAEWDAVFNEPVDTNRVSVVLKLLGRDVDVEVTHAQVF